MINQDNYEQYIDKVSISVNKMFVRILRDSREKMGFFLSKVLRRIYKNFLERLF